MDEAANEVVSLFQCCLCSSFVTSPEGFRLHGEKCRSRSGDKDEGLEAGTGIGPEGEGRENDNDEKSMKPVVFPIAKVALHRLTPAEIEIGRGSRGRDGEDADVGVGVMMATQSIVMKRGRKKQLDCLQQAAVAASMPPEGRTPRPRQARMKAMSSMREATEEEKVVKGENGEEEDQEEENDWECSSDSEEKDLTDYDDDINKPSNSNPGKRRISANSQSKQCSECNAYFESKPKLDRHFRAVHANADKQEDALKCPLCDKMFSRSLFFRKHLKAHTDAEGVEDAFNLWEGWPKSTVRKRKQMRFTCKYCVIAHTSHKSFLTHMKTRHGDKGRACKWTCTYSSCSTEEFLTIKQFVAHIRESHQEMYNGKYHENRKDPDKRPTRPCEECGKMVDVYHMKLHKIREHSIGGTSNTKYIRRVPEENKYQCPLPDCLKRLKTLSFLKSHFVLHLENNPFVCKVPGCGVRTDAQSHLERHMKIHTGELRVECPKCGLSYTRLDKLLLHDCTASKARVKVHADGTTRSSSSKLRLKRIDKSGLNNDGEYYNGEVNLEVKAEANPTEVDTKLRRKRERQKININMIMMTDPIFIKACEDNPGFKELMFSTRREKKGERMYKCDKCQTAFTVLQAMKKHRDTCNGAELPQDREKLDCNLTGKSCPDPKPVADSENHSNLVDYNSSSSKYKFGCRICGDSFDTKELFNLHIENDHDPEQVFKCEKCGEVYATALTRNRHVSKTHVEFPFQCHICKNKYKLEQSLQEHLKKHNSSEGVHYCPECKREFSGITGLRRHSLTMHGVTIPLSRNYKRKAKRAPARKSKFKKGRTGRKSRRAEPEPTDTEDEDEETLADGNDSSPTTAATLVKVERDLHINDTGENGFNAASTVKVEPGVPKTEVDVNPLTHQVKEEGEEDNPSALILGM